MAVDGPVDQPCFRGLVGARWQLLLELAQLDALLLDLVEQLGARASRRYSFIASRSCQNAVAASLRACSSEVDSCAASDCVSAWS